MKLDTTSYYPESPLGPEEDSKEKEQEIAKAAEKVVVISGESPSEQELDEDYVPDDIGMEQIPHDESRAVTAVSHLLSWVLVPLMMPVYGIMLAFSLSILHYTPMTQRIIYVLIVAAFNIGVPAVAVLLMKKMGVVKDVGLNRRKERTLPYVVTILCMAATGVFMYIKGAPMWLVMFFGGGCLAGLIELIVNFRWKISAHSAGMAGIVALLLRILQDGMPQSGTLVWLMVAIGLSGMLGSARIWLGRHTIWQVAAGYAVGFCSVYFLTMIH